MRTRKNVQLCSPGQHGIKKNKKTVFTKKSKKKISTEICACQATIPVQCTAYIENETSGLTMISIKTLQNMRTVKNAFELLQISS